ncbi:MAG TPA: class II fumarate hydratase [Streptosporangiaceae bacterium]|jgi:fumarate hydratase class II|nr:class II fumarate hydratase [Streptosporangiaceae bacterium]
MSDSRSGASEYRIEHDSMGDVEVPADALWAAQTQRASAHRLSGETMPREVIIALAMIKSEAAAVNAELGVIDADMAQAIREAALEIAVGETGDGGHFEDFPLDVFQTGSGTSTNMNANEVIATLATRRLGRPVHPNDHVNASQSSNDVFPSAVHIAAARTLTALVGALDQLAIILEGKAAEFAEVVKSGRTHLMDAVPVTLGQEFSGYAAAVRHGMNRIRLVLPEVSELPLGGTAVGTGLNAPPGFAAAVIQRLATEAVPFTEAANHFEAAGGRDALVAASGVLKTVAVSLYKICTDLRLMGSGPRTGLAEIAIPELQPGSSIMPGKVNPVICEMVSQACAQVIGNDSAIAFAGAAGNFELNVMIPVIARNLLGSANLLIAGAPLLADRCVAGISTNPARLRRLAESSPAIVTALNRFIGYEAAAAVAHEALASGKTIRDVVLARGHVERGEITLDQLDEALDVLAMTNPGR